MRTGIAITLTPSDRQRLEAVASNRNTAQKHVWRAVIVLLSADGVCTTEIMRRTGTSETCACRWPKRFTSASRRARRRRRDCNPAHWACAS